MAQEEFRVEQQVRFRGSAFFDRSVGHFANVRKAIEEGLILTVVRTSRFWGDQFLTVRRPDGTIWPRELNANLFELVP
ncbi:MAG: hypothetical protein AAB495_00860 [Patescibacteria group bacterium]